MGIYILRRLALIIPTLIGIMLLNFVIVQAAPGGPVEQLIAEMEGHGGSALARASGGGTGGEVADSSGDTRGSRGIPDELLKEIEVMYGFDKPAHERFFKMLGDYATFNFGDSFFREKSVIDLIIDKMPVSISLGLWSTLIIYFISIPLGIRKAVTDGSRFDVWTSSAIVVGYAIPGFLFAILLIVLFAGGSYFDWFPLRGLTSSNFDELTWYQKIGDYFWHLALPVTANVIGGFATLTLLTKNSFLDEIGKQYVVTARAKGLVERRVILKHAFRNALTPIVTLTALLFGELIAGAVLTEQIFTIPGFGKLVVDAVFNRDYAVVQGIVLVTAVGFIFMNLLADVAYVLLNPRLRKQ